MSTDDRVSTSWPRCEANREPEEGVASRARSRRDGCLAWDADLPVRVGARILERPAAVGVPRTPATTRTAAPDDAGRRRAVVGPPDSLGYGTMPARTRNASSGGTTSPLASALGCASTGETHSDGPSRPKKAGSSEWYGTSSSAQAASTSA